MPYGDFTFQSLRDKLSLHLGQDASLFAHIEEVTISKYLPIFLGNTSGGETLNNHRDGLCAEAEHLWIGGVIGVGVQVVSGESVRVGRGTAESSTGPALASLVPAVLFDEPRGNVHSTQGVVVRVHNDLKRAAELWYLRIGRGYLGFDKDMNRLCKEARDLLWHGIETPAL